MHFHTDLVPCTPATRHVSKRAKSPPNKQAASKNRQNEKADKDTENAFSTPSNQARFQTVR
jgi:hypothetical protein